MLPSSTGFPVQIPIDPVGKVELTMQKRKFSSSKIVALWWFSLLLTACAKAQATPNPLAVEAVILAPTATLTWVTPKATPLPDLVAQPAGCTVVSFLPTPGPTEESLFPSVNDQDWTLGPRDAAITIIEYGDFQ